MARIRTIKPDLAQSKSVAKLPFDARYFFAIILCWLDDAGRVEWQTKRLAGEMFPNDEEVGRDDLNRWLLLCCDAGVLARYTNEGVVYVCAPKFLEHQVINRPTKSILPGPTDEGSEITHGALSESSVSPHALLTEGSSPEREREREREQGGGKEQTPLTPEVSEAVTNYLDHRKQAKKKPYTDQGLKTLKARIVHLDPKYAIHLLGCAMVGDWEGIPSKLLPSSDGTPPVEYLNGHGPAKAGGFLNVL